MNILSTLNSDHLRTFLAIQKAGSVTGGANLIGRSQSATSLQLKQLEATIGSSLFYRHGRGVILTASGEQLRPKAMQIVSALDATLTELKGETLQGKLRVGISDDHSRAKLARILADFSERHPVVDLEVHCALGAKFAGMIGNGQLDLAVFELPTPAVGDIVLREDHLMWCARRDSQICSKDVLPIAVFDLDCWWRDLAVSSLEDAQQRFEIRFMSESTSSVYAAIDAGIAAGLVSIADKSPHLQAVPGLAMRYPTSLIMRRAEGLTSDLAGAMSAAIQRAYKLNSP